MKNTYIIQRILYTIFIFALVVTLCFFIPRIGVEDPCARYYPAQGNMSDENYEMIKELTRQQYGLDGSNWSQYVRYVKNLLKGDLGTSYQAGSPKVWSLIAQRLPWTLVLSVSSMLISLFFGILIGAACAAKRGGMADRALMNASTVTTAVPSFFIALLLSFFLGFQLEWFPAYTDQNMVSEFAWNLKSVEMVAYNAVLPVLSTVVGGIVSYAQSTRNSVLPIVTGLGMGLSGLIGGSVVIEKIFNWQGIGMLYLEANNNNDYPLMMGIMIFMAAVALLGNLMTDLCLGLLDPRVTVE